MAIGPASLYWFGKALELRRARVPHKS